jgi:hypothetical protein
LFGALTIAEGNGTGNINMDFSGGASPVLASGLTVAGGTGADLLTITGTPGTAPSMVPTAPTSTTVIRRSLL